MNNLSRRTSAPLFSPTLHPGRLAPHARVARSMAALEELTEQLVQEKASAAWDADQLASLRRAADDAAALAWGSAYPLLVLPELFAEKADEAFMQSERQREIRRRSRALIALAV